MLDNKLLSSFESKMDFPGLKIIENMTRAYGDAAKMQSTSHLNAFGEGWETLTDNKCIGIPVTLMTSKVSVIKWID